MDKSTGIRVVVCRLKGGLGNQMFQFAYGYARALRLNAELQLDLSYFDKDARHGGFAIERFELSDKAELIKLGFWSKTLVKLEEQVIGRVDRVRGIVHEERTLENRFFKYGSQLYLNGFWQNPSLFDVYTQQIKRAFRLKSFDYSSEFLNVKSEILHSQSVGVHFRRGDYVSDKNAASVHGVLGEAYYLKAVQKIEESIECPRYFVFSDDIKAAKKELDFLENAVFVDSVSDSMVADMHLMSLCKYNIIANSTYSWWSAWLNDNDMKMVVAPKQWFSNQEKNQQCKIIPSEWITV
jgi:hypothetical protein